MSLKIRCTDKNCGVCNPRVVPIPLPPEPPRDRVIEAVDQDGAVMASWDYDGSDWNARSRGWHFDWDELVQRVMFECWSLRHVPAEETS